MAASCGSYLIVTLFILLPVQCTDKVVISKVIDALTKLLLFYKDNLKQSNLDGFFGLRVIEGQLSVIIELYNKGKFQAVDSSFLHSLKFLLEEAGKVVKATPSIWNQEPNYFGLHKTLLERPWKIYHSPQLINSALKWDDFPDWSSYQVEAEPTSVENCLSEIVMKNYRHGCSLSNSCMDLMLQSGKHGSFLTHQILYVILTEEFNCLTPALNYLKVKNRATDTDHLLLEFCTNSYFDLVGIEKVIDNREELQDLFMEIEFICGHLGFVEFMKMGYLEKIISWQKPSGCFANRLDDNFYRNNQKKEKVIKNYLNPQQVAAKINQIPIASDKENSLNLKKPEAQNPIPPGFQNFKFNNQNNMLLFQAKAQNPVIYDANAAGVKQQNYPNMQTFDRQGWPHQVAQNVLLPLDDRQQIHGDSNNFQPNWNNQWNNMAAPAAAGQNQNLNWQGQNIEKMDNFHNNFNIGQVNKKYDSQNYRQKNIDENNFELLKKQDNINQFKFNQPVEMNNNNVYQAKDTFDKILPAENQFGYVANDFARQNLENIKRQSMVKDLNPNNFMLNPNNQWNQGKEFVDSQGNHYQPRAAFNQFQQNINPPPPKWLMDQNSYKKDDDQANGYMKRKLLEAINYDGCLNHKTAMAAGALTAYLRFLLDPGSENIQQMRIDTPNSDLNLHDSKVDVYNFQPKEVLSDLDLDQGLGEGIPQPGDNIPEHFEHEKNIQKPQHAETKKPKIIDGQDLRNFANELVREPINLQVGAQQDLRDFANKQVKLQPSKKSPKKLESKIKSNDNINYDFHDQPDKNDKKFDDHEYHMDKIKGKTERFHSDSVMLQSPKDLDSSVQRSFIIICVITGVCLYILFRFIKVRRLAFRYKFSHKV